MSLPSLIQSGGPVAWLLLLMSALAIGIFIERFLHYHRAQIHSAGFLEGIRNVLRQANVVEAISICDATPGPVAQLVRAAILRKDSGRESVRDALEETGLIEVSRLEEKLNLLATIAQIAPLLGLFGTILGMIDIFFAVSESAVYPGFSKLAEGIMKALTCAAAGLAIAIPSYAAYNYLVSRVNSIVLDMEKASTEIINIVLEAANPDGKESR